MSKAVVTDDRLEQALDAFWNVAYQQGQEQRGHDDVDGTAQKADDDLRRAIAALSHSAEAVEPGQKPFGYVYEEGRPGLVYKEGMPPRFTFSKTKMAISDDDMSEFEISETAVFAAPVSTAQEWQPISTCPIQEAVDLWCVYGGEEFARFDGGASIGKLVSGKHKHPQYGFFGNQSNDGVPRGGLDDLRPVAWREAVPNCPAELIAEVMEIPLTLEAALALSEKQP